MLASFEHKPKGEKNLVWIGISACQVPIIFTKEIKKHKIIMTKPIMGTWQYHFDAKMQNKVENHSMVYLLHKLSTICCSILLGMRTRNQKMAKSVCLYSQYIFMVVVQGASVISKKHVLWQIMWIEATSEQRILHTVHKFTSTSIPRKKKKKRRSHQRWLGGLYRITVPKAKN